MRIGVIADHVPGIAPLADQFPAKRAVDIATGDKDRSFYV